MILGGRIFRFKLSSFRLAEGFSLRRFSIMEATVLLIFAFIASRGLGVIRQSIFNAVFGAGPAANAYYAAFRLPDFLFNLIAGGALSNALIRSPRLRLNMRMTMRTPGLISCASRAASTLPASS